MVSDPGGNQLAQTVHIFNGSPLDARTMNGTSCNAWNEGLESQTNSGITANGGSVQSVWNGYASQSGCMNNPLVVSQVTTLSDTNQQSRIAFGYDQYGNITDKQYYDWGTGAAGALVREEKTQYNYISGTANGVAVSLLNKPSQVTITNGSAVVSQNTYQYDQQSPSDAPGVGGHDSGFTTAFNLRGNLTNVASCTNPPACSSVINHPLTYDIAGNILTAADGKGNTTTLSYNDDGQNQYVFATSVNNALGQKTSARYDYNIGEPVTTTDANGNVTSSQYNDPLDRLTQTSFPDGGATYNTYPDPNTVLTNRDQSTAGDKYQQTKQAYDGLGRPTESDLYEYWQISPYAITSSTIGYDPLGRKASLTVNSWSGSPASYQETYTYDSIGRLTSVTTPADGASTTRAFAGNQVTETDQAGITKASWTDALGRLTQVVEDPNGSAYSTAYSYDPLGNLTLVSQNMTCPATAPTQAAQGCRYYSFDALGRLQWSLQPESGKTSYQYDNASNVTTSTDSRGVKSTYTYDALNRVKQISYSGGTVSTPGISYTYDTGTNGIGHLSTAAVSGGTITSYTAFDAIGRIKAHTQQTTTGHTYTFSYGYDLAGNLISETYPSGRIIQTGYDGMNRPGGVNGQWQGTSSTYVWNTYYNLANNLTQLSFGNNAYRFFSYNPRLQLQEIQDAPNTWSTLPEDCGYTPNGGFGYNLDLKLFWGAGQTQTASNNGTLRGAIMQSCAAPLQASSFTQNYGYDSVNRLTSMTDSGGAGSAQAFSYDAYGNMWSNTTGTLPANTGAPTANVYNSANQLTTASYDAAGNQTSLPSYCSNCLSFDGENHLVTYSGPTPATYTYDSAGNRVTKKVGSTTTVYVYDAFNSLIAEYSSNATAAVTPCDRCYISWDHLGSTRMVTDANGNTVSLHDFEPFGGEINSGYAGRGSAWGGTADNVVEKFTGQVRDQESGLDYFNARYFASALGRFTSPDPGNAGADLYDPQTWNGYGYVRNNPLALVDPSGYCSVFIAGITQSQDSKAAFTQIANQFGADQAYPYSGQGVLLSGSVVASEVLSDWSNPATATALQALKGALSNNSGSVDVVAYSGGAAAFTSAYNNLSAPEQNRIGNIVYISPGAAGDLAGNASTSTVIGSGFLDTVATSFETFAPGPLKHSGCAHQDFACLAQAASAPLSIVKANGPCTNQQTFSLRPTPSKGSASSTIHYGGSVSPGTGGPLNNPFSYVPLFGGVGGEDQSIPPPDTYFRSN